MKQYWDKVLALVLLVGVGLAVGCNGAGAQPPAANADNSSSPPFSAAQQALTISKGTPIYVRLQQSISSSSASSSESSTMRTRSLRGASLTQAALEAR